VNLLGTLEEGRGWWSGRGVMAEAGDERGGRGGGGEGREIRGIPGRLVRWVGGGRVDS